MTVNNTNVVPIWDAIRRPDIGIVSWYYFLKGYGYITPIDGGLDVFVHASQLRKSNIEYLSSGTYVQFVRVVTDDGKIIASDLVVLPPDSTQLAEEQLDPYEQLAIHNGCIKWFNHERRFGCVKAEGFAEYIFLHESVLLAAGLVPYGRFNGQNVRVRVGPDFEPNKLCVKEIVND